ncbi:MAG: LrgB family protein [Lawsonibacter sp.]|jgi:predicted murein hydrolase (TIGR00659 family)
MVETLLSSPFFGLFLTCVSWSVGVWVQKKTGSPLCNPLVIATALIIIFLMAFHIPYENYAIGGSLLSMMLGPATAVLALNIFHQRKLLGRYFFPVFVGCLAGTLTSMGLVLALCHLLEVEQSLTAALLPKSVTTAIALAISESQGGVPGITAAAVILAGVVGAMFAPTFAKIFRVNNPVAEGVAIGAASHALGTAKALEIGSLQGAMSSVSLCLCGIMTSLLVLFL